MIQNTAAQGTGMNRERYSGESWTSRELAQQPGEDGS